MVAGMMIGLLTIEVNKVLPQYILRFQSRPTNNYPLKNYNRTGYITKIFFIGFLYWWHEFTLTISLFLYYNNNNWLKYFLLNS